MPYINRWLISSGPVRGSLEDLTVTPEGVTVRGLKFNDSKTGEIMLQLPELKITGGWRQYLNRQLESISVNNVEVTLTEPFLEQLLNRPDDVFLVKVTYWLGV